MKPKILFLVGPTAIGKTEIALSLAKKTNAEIISCDSMQLYKGLDILTSKPTLEFTRKIPHHLIGIISPEKEYNVSRYRLAAIRKIKEITKRNKTPLFVGGSGLYMSVVIDGIFKAKTENPSVRKRIYEEAAGFGSAYVYGRLKDLDPSAAQKIHPNDTKRIARALEVFEVTGKPISQLQAERKGLADKYDIKVFCLYMTKEELNRRIDKRVDQMFKQGLVEEVKKILRLKISKTAQAAIGVNEIKGYLKGLYDLQEAKRLIKINTRQYARRQMTWFRKDKRIQWIETKSGERRIDLVKRIVREL
jgi:tRNA dimethylallyltransferase